jgi:hypothetical protein
MDMDIWTLGTTNSQTVISSAQSQPNSSSMLGVCICKIILHIFGFPSLDENDELGWLFPPTG